MRIPEFSSYDITEDGVVTEIATGRIIHHYKVHSSKHYPYIRVSLVGDDGLRHACNVLRLLAMTFLEKPYGPCTARAKDGNNLNISLDNVSWVPYAKSTLYAWKAGKYTSRKPKKSNCCTEESMELLLNALEQLDSPISVAALSRVLDIPYSTVRYTLIALEQHDKVKHVSGKGFVIA